MSIYATVYVFSAMQSKPEPGWSSGSRESSERICKKTYRKRYNEVAREWTRKYAMWLQRVIYLTRLFFLIASSKHFQLPRPSIPRDRN